MIDDNRDECGGEVVQFGRRPIPPRACVVENKTHVRTFLSEMLDELGFIARETQQSSELCCITSGLISLCLGR